jgi:hypothetical protein
VTRDEKTDQRRGLAAGGGVLGSDQAGSDGKSGTILPQMKELKKRKLKVAGSAAKNPTADAAEGPGKIPAAPDLPLLFQEWDGP